MRRRQNLAQLILLLAVALAIRLPFLNHAIQGDDPFYLAMAMHAQIDPLHPNHFLLTAEGAQVDMRGFPHPPLNAWALGALLALLGDIREVPFHAFYILFSLIAVSAVWWIARRFSDRPLWAALLFAATPAFVVNGSSLESDLPFLAWWLAACALFLSAVDSGSNARLAGAAVAAALAAMTAYQAVALTPVLAVYLWQRKRNWKWAWAALAAPLAAVVAWQAWMRWTTGEMPVSVLAGYMSSHSLQSLARKWRNAVALTTHLGWVVFPALAWSAAFRRNRWLLAAAAPALALAAFDPHPLAWLSLASGLMVLAVCAADLRGDADTRFLAAWVLLFFAACLAIFFAGSARYLLPLAAPAAVLLSRSQPRWLPAACFAVQLAVSLGLALANRDQWDGYRAFVASLAEQGHFNDRRVWINGEMGLRFYAEAAGGLPMLRGQAVRPGDLVLTSALAHPLPYTTGGGSPAPLARSVINSPLPFRLFSLDQTSAWSLADGGYRPFGISGGPIDRVRADAVAAVAPALSYLPMNSPEVASQVISGIHQLDGADNTWRWTSGRVVVLLKAPEEPSVVEATFRVPDQMTGKRVSLSLDGGPSVSSVYAASDLFTLKTAPVLASGGTAVVTLSTDGVFQVPGDRRELALILTGIGFQPRQAK